jgi:hypothetical protein
MARPLERVTVLFMTAHNASPIYQWCYQPERTSWNCQHLKRLEQAAQGASERPFALLHPRGRIRDVERAALAKTLASDGPRLLSREQKAR